ncbi:type I polyketide synthase domain protein [Mycobacterium ulcerans str. Harvey]|uniref:Type I polyketide synthase domain protein n=1 Tax=Mycobacterium ulcerans str. Harvey TaxID=1299332 RepID=A0ABP3A4U2_MYCUL|nr:type I polyketide synthase domain protein [Mycobacterium ulcerans str. Harvey]
MTGMTVSGAFAPSTVADHRMVMTIPAGGPSPKPHPYRWYS